jgi:hypothetical protein
MGFLGFSAVPLLVLSCHWSDRTITSDVSFGVFCLFLVFRRCVAVSVVPLAGFNRALEAVTFHRFFFFLFSVAPSALGDLNLRNASVLFVMFRWRVAVSASLAVGQHQ